MIDDRRLYAPAAARNREPIREVLQRHLPPAGLVLEIASGTGEHVAFLAGASAPELIFQPSDPDAAARASIDAWATMLSLPNVRPAIALDAASPVWPATAADAARALNGRSRSSSASKRGSPASPHATTSGTASAR